MYFFIIGNYLYERLISPEYNCYEKLSKKSA